MKGYALECDESRGEIVKRSKRRENERGRGKEKTKKMRRIKIDRQLKCFFSVRCPLFHQIIGTSARPSVWLLIIMVAIEIAILKFFFFNGNVGIISSLTPGMDVHIDR